MAAMNHIPTFNLKVVLRETGLKPDTLRAWERRYGLPHPERSVGGHRLYSQRDVDIIKWLMARQQEGMSISRAADLWHSLETGGQDPLQAAEFTLPEAPASVAPLPEGEAIAQLRRAWVSACLAYEEQGVERTLTQAFALYPAEVVCLEFLQKGLAEVGEGWYRGEVTVQQEHFASELAIRRLEVLLAAAPPPTRPNRILVACPPEEEHTFSTLLLTLLLRRRGWDVLYLGANVPAARLESAIAAARPHLVILVAQQLHTAATLLDVALSLREKHVMLAFGGLVFNLSPALRRRIPGYFLGERLELAPQAVEQTLASPPPLPPAEPVSQAYQRALAHYREQQGLIDARMWHLMESTGIRYNHLTLANTHLALNAMAGLALGDMDFLGVDIEWVSGLLSHHGLPGDLLPRYLSAYYEAARAHLDERAAPLLAWLGRVTAAGSSLESSS